MESEVLLEWTDYEYNVVKTGHAMICQPRAITRLTRHNQLSSNSCNNKCVMTTNSNQVLSSTACYPSGHFLYFSGVVAWNAKIKQEMSHRIQCRLILSGKTTYTNMARWFFLRIKYRIRYTTVVGKYPETTQLLIGSEPATIFLDIKGGLSGQVSHIYYTNWYSFNSQLISVSWELTH